MGVSVTRRAARRFMEVVLGTGDGRAETCSDRGGHGPPEAPRDLRGSKQ